MTDKPTARVPCAETRGDVGIVELHLLTRMWSNVCGQIHIMHILVQLSVTIQQSVISVCPWISVDSVVDRHVERPICRPI